MIGGRRRAAAVVAVLLATISLAGCSGQGPDPTTGGASAASPSVPPADASTGGTASASGRPSVTPSQVPVMTAQRAGSVVAETPVAVRLPTGRVVPVEAVSSRADGRLDVPTDITHAGWWRGGSRLGDPFGSTLLAAHVDSFTQGLGPFEQLLVVRAGQEITVRSAHLTQTFRIDSLRLVPQGSLADDSWIYAATGQRRLTLVTCAPPYDRSRGGYQNLAVVTALPEADAHQQKD